MALPEDDVEEIDPEPSLARILDHEHDAIVVGPGLRPGLATAELVRELIDIGGQDQAPIVLDAEALRSLASIDAWWEGGRRPAVLTPHAGEFARLRAGAGRDPADDGDLADDDAARAAAARDAARTWGQVVVLKGAADGDRVPRRRARGRPVREPGPRLGRHRRRPRRDDRIAPGPGSRPIRRRAARGVPARARGRPGPRALRRLRASSPPTCPRASRWRASAWPPPRSVAPPRAGSGSRPSDGRAPPHRGAALGGRAPAAAADRVAGDRPRRAWSRTSRPSAARSRPAPRSGRWSKRTRTGTGPCRWRGRCRTPAWTACASRPSTRPSSCATRASRRRSRSCTRSRPSSSPTRPTSAWR